MRKENWIKKAFGHTMAALKRLFSWFARAFSSSKLPNLINGNGEETEQIESPSKLLRKAFFQKKTAVVALVILASLFLFVFIAPLFIPMDVNYTDPLQQNVSPDYSLRSVPKSLKNSVLEIDGFSAFTVGLSSEGEVFVWGNSKDRLNKTDLKEIPERVKKEGAVKIAAGKDHILAVTKAGKFVGWGDKSCGQYGSEQVLNALSMPAFLEEGIEPSLVKQLACGYQTSALVTTDGKLYAWGNTNVAKNLAGLSRLENVEKVAFTNSALVALTRDGSLETGLETVFTSAVSSRHGAQSSLASYLQDKKIKEIATTNKCLALVLEDGELVVSGVFENGEDKLPSLQAGEFFTQLEGGTRHFVGVTNAGRVYAWGHNAYKQCDVVGERAARVFAGSLQTYLVGEGGKLEKSVGLKGYLMGTDGRGRDVFARIAHGGKMTMTIGAVAVLISSAIAVLVGCVSGYFGGFVDTFLMRVTEIFSSIPFLPFAMLLSQIIKNYNVSENMRIFIIMLILGALSWTGLARILRGQVLAEREKEFVVAAKALGVKERTIAFKHVLPNVISVILVSMTLDFAGCLLTESSLSYLGFGVQQPQPTWGNMLTGSNNSTVIQNYSWQWLFPSLFLSLATICINVVGDALRDALDPKSRKEK